MPNRRNLRPAIVWGDALDKTILFGYPLDESMSYGLPREGSEQVQGSSGVEDGWDEGTDFYLDGVARYIPRETGNTPEGFSATGWEDANGWDAFLNWARTGKAFRWCFDRGDLGTYVASYLVAPRDGPPELEENFTRRVVLRIRNAAGAYTGY